MLTPFVTTLCVFVLRTRAITYLDTTASSGKSTYYGGNTGGGACGYEDVPTASFPFGYYAACGGTAFDDGYGCGACYEITCIGPYSPNPGCSCDADTPSVIVSCMDQCPECSATHFDLDPTAMARIVGDGLSGTCGVIETTIRRVACEYTGNIKIRSKSGTSEYWFGLHIDDAANYGAVTAVRLKSSGSSSYTTTCTKGEGPSFWVCAGGYPLAAPVSVELTSDSGEILTCDGCIESFAGSTEWDFGANFQSTSVGTPATASTPSPVSAPVNTPSPVVPSSGGGSSDYIVIRNDGATQDYYLSFYVDNMDASSCSDNVASVQILQNNVWRGHNQYYNEGSTADPNHRFAFDYTGVAFGSMLPISVRIVMTSGREIDMYGIMEDLGTTSEFTSTALICDGTLSPTAPTPQPTTRVPTAPTTPYPTGPTVCIDEGALQWRSYDNQLYLNGNVFHMKGLSWFGFETGNYALYGLDVHSVDWYLQWMVDNGFNAIRLPFSQDFVESGAANRNAYRAVVSAAGAKGLLVMPDFHSKTAGSWLDGLDTINKATAIATWETMADLLIDEWNVFIADAFNEPHDVSNAEWAEWVAFCEDVAAALWAKGVNWMVAVEGTNWECDVINCAWGENLEGVRNTGVTFSLDAYGANRFVWSPHVYGADVTGNAYSTAGWQSHWGYLTDGSYPSNEAASLIGEFGTRYNTAAMQSWLGDLVDYLIAIDQRNTFFWCLNPNSGDTGGLLQDDWTTPETGKLAQLEKLQPSPSVLEYNAGAGQVCVSFEGGVVATPTPITPTRTTTTPAPVLVTPSPTTPAPVLITPSPVTPAPTTKSPTTPVTPSPVTPSPVTLSPTTKAPTTKAPTTTTPAPVINVTPSPVPSEPMTPAPVTPSPVVMTPSPTTPAPVLITPSPVTSAPTISPTTPVTPSPVTPSPVTSEPTTAAPVTASPVTPSPVTSEPTAPVTPSPVSPSPVTPAPVDSRDCVCILNYVPYCCDGTEEFSNDCFATCEGYNVTASCVQDTCNVGGSTTIATEVTPVDPNISGAGRVSTGLIMAMMMMVVGLIRA